MRKESLNMPANAMLLGLACGLALGQAADPRLTFEVASVKPAAPQPNGRTGTRGGPGTSDPGRIAYTNVTLKLVLNLAYDVQSDQISGPAWLDSARYDITATLPPGAGKEQFKVMLQNLAAERFQLGFHREKKDFVVWELGVAKNGPKLTASVPNRGPAPAAPAAGRGRTDRDGFPLPPPHQTAQGSANGVARMAGNQITMAALAQFLKFPMAFVDGGPGTTSFSSGRVVDKTGLPGEYDVRLEYEWPGPPPPGADPDGAPSIFTALQQQLGLKLDRTKAPLDVLVIDHAEKVPVEN
jgi:uncharacterized protein (TIGR03435 family)